MTKMIISPRATIVAIWAPNTYAVLVDGVQWGPDGEPRDASGAAKTTYETAELAWLAFREANPNEPNLNDMAKEMVGDGKEPNLFFVTVDGSTLVAYDDLARAKEYADTDSEFEIMIEDRLTGVVWENAASLATQGADDDADEDAVCPNTHGGSHVLDTTVTYADTPTSSTKGIVVDVWCKACGRSGSLVIEPNDVNW